MKINLGCGENRLEGWSNHDRDVDITKPLPWADNSVDFILIEHCLEHVTGPESYRFMKEAYRILKPRGVLRVCVPQLRDVDREKAEDLIINHGHLQVFCAVTLTQMLKTAASWECIEWTGRKECDGHWKVIGEALDTAETLRMEATK